MYRFARYAALPALIFCLAGPTAALDLEGYDLVDLTHAYNEDTIYWPTSPTTFEKETLSEGETPGGWYYSAYSVGTPEHGGTHLDAPVHFAEGKLATHELPLGQLIAPAVVIDVADKAATDRDYRLTVDDVLEFEVAHGEIAAGTIVLLRTGWSRYWPDTLAYLGDDTPGDATNLSFPSFGVEAATLLVEARGIATLGVDTASIDYGRSEDFLVHRVAGAHNVAGLENLARLDALPATGATVIALPMKIEGGSGGPVRVVALVPKHSK
jgi:kynurenine formamidase